MFNLAKSPIRRNIKKLNDGQLSIFEEDDLFGHGDNMKRFQVKTILKDIENMLETMEVNRDENLKIAVMGEVKAGKSTFINACVKKEIAYTDILEATAIVSEISYSENEYARVRDKQGKIVIESSIEDLIEWTEAKLDNEEDFLEYEKIEIGVSSELLKNMVLVDTPGLLSITSENHDVTNDYIAQTDYVLWVMNSRNLGSKAVNDFIDKIKLSGKPLIGIVNKVDSEEVLLEIKQYVEDNYSSVFEEIFYISAGNAWNAFINGDSIQEDKSGINEVLELLEDLSEDKGYSSGRTQYYQLQREKELHTKIYAIIAARKEYYDNEIAVFKQVNNEMKKVITEELQHWCETELYMEEKKELMSADKEQFDKLFENYSSAAYFTNILDGKYREMSDFIYKKWGLIETSLTNNFAQILIDFNYDKNFNEEIPFKPSEDAIVLSSDGIQKGLEKGTVVGLAFAGFAAWLGPSAATITFASALIPYAVPLAIGGALLGGWKGGRNAIGMEERARSKRAQVEDLYQEIVKASKEEVERIRKDLVGCTNYYYDERCKSYEKKAKKLNFSFTEPEYGEFITELEAYIQDINDIIAAADNEPIEGPPKMEESSDS